MAAGEIGELVITNFGRTGSPVIRYRTGDLVQAETSPHASGRTWLRLKGGILGRVDDMLIIRGNNVFPSSIEAIIGEFTEIVEFRLIVSQQREMHHLRIEIEPQPELGDDSLRELTVRLSGTIKDRLNFQAEIHAVAVGFAPAVRDEIAAHCPRITPHRLRVRRPFLLRFTRFPELPHLQRMPS